MLQVGSARWLRSGVPLLLVLYLALMAFPLIHPLLESRGRSYHSCPAEQPGWLIVSHPPDQPCSDPDHHHHPRPVHDEDHCPTCRLSGAAVGLPSLSGDPVGSTETPCFAAMRNVLLPLPPELLALSARAPPRPLGA